MGLMAGVQFQAEVGLLWVKRTEHEMKLINHFNLALRLRRYGVVSMPLRFHDMVLREGTTSHLHLPLSC